MSPHSLLEIRDLYVSAKDKEILHGVNLNVRQGEIHSIMGPNGSGKSTLSNAIIGNPAYTTKGRILFKGRKIHLMNADKRASLGIFFAFQSPVAIPGVSLRSLIRTFLNEKRGKQSYEEFNRELESITSLIGFNRELLNKELNVKLSGGEKKMSEMLQLLMFRPELAIIDEIDSGLDIDALKRVSRAIELLSKKSGVILITHHTTLHKYIQPTQVHVLVNGAFVESGGIELADKIEREGYSAWLKKKNSG